MQQTAGLRGIPRIVDGNRFDQQACPQGDLEVVAQLGSGKELVDSRGAETIEFGGGSFAASILRIAQLPDQLRDPVVGGAGPTGHRHRGSEQTRHTDPNKPLHGGNPTPAKGPSLES